MLAKLAPLVAGLALTANAHMFISSPPPIPDTAVKPPLDPSGSNFPCHGVSLPSSGGNKMSAGSMQMLAFNLGGGANTAVHGGGSCQMAITYETKPAKLKDPSSWKVIYSVEGGCPTDAKGNLPMAVKCKTGSEIECVNQFPFKIPKGVKSGHAIMAWTWFNSVGNREMYMNCINVDFDGGDESEIDSFPDLFVANLASVNQCGTKESTNVKFPNPGKYHDVKTEGNPYPIAPPTDSGCGAGNGGDDSPPAPKYQPPAAPKYQTPAALDQDAVDPPQGTAPEPQQPTAPIAPAPPPVAPAPSGSCTDGTIPCPTPGQLICVDEAHFGLCDIDFCALPQPVAPGTRCVDGKIAKKKRKRSLEEHKRMFQHGHGHHA